MMIMHDMSDEIAHASEDPKTISVTWLKVMPGQLTVRFIVYINLQIVKFPSNSFLQPLFICRSVYFVYVTESAEATFQWIAGTP
jgi:hypothetical protein